MSVETEADAALDAAHRKLCEAFKDMSKVLVDRCRGHNEYSADVSRRLREAYSLTLAARDLMDVFRRVD